MKQAHETCRNCGAALETSREQSRGVCDDCPRTEVTK